MINLSVKLKGSLVMISFAIITALSSIFIHATTQRIHPILSVFYTFFSCVIFYNLVSLTLLQKTKLLIKHWRMIIMLNVMTAACWIFTFLSLKIIPPELYLFVYLCAMPISSSLFITLHLLRAIIAFVVLILLIITYQTPSLTLGVVLAFIGGICGTIYTIYAKQLTYAFSTLEILAMRFILTVIITFLLTLYLNILHLPTSYDMFRFIVLSLFSVILPLILFQMGIRDMKIEQALAYLPLAPLICYAINLISGFSIFNPWQFLIVILLATIMFIQLRKT